jgi:hypothetical protein
MRMKVSEIKAKFPEAAVYEINPNARYIVIVNKTLISSNTACQLAAMMPKDTVIISVVDTEGAVRFLEAME